MQLRARRARAADAPVIHALIEHYAAEGILLARSEENVRKHISYFLVLEERQQVIGCVSLEHYGTDLAEIRSLAVAPDARGRGLGGRLVQFAMAEARLRKIARVFAVTHAPDFFVRQGFTTSSRRALPEKIDRDCCACPKARACRLTAVVATVFVPRVALPILQEVATSSV